MRRQTYQELCDEIEAATDVAFFGGLEASANIPEEEGQTGAGAQGSARVG